MNLPCVSKALNFRDVFEENDGEKVHRGVILYRTFRIFLVQSRSSRMATLLVACRKVDLFNIKRTAWDTDRQLR